MSTRANEPIFIRDRTCLFLDNRFIAEQSGLKRTWHQGKPQPEPAITGNWPHMFGSALYDPQSKLYKMWYEDVRDGMGWIHYAESNDGKKWRKPALGLVEIDGSKTNNCIMKRAELPNVFLDPNDTDPQGRFKMFLWSYPIKFQDKEISGHVLFRSGDGIRWEPMGPRPEIALPEGDETGQARTVLDTHEIIWDPLGQRYLGAFRLFPLHPGIPGWFRNEKHEMSEGIGGHRRAVGVSTSKQLLSGWSRMITVLKPDAKDDEKVAKLGRNDKLDWAELYVMPVFVYGNHYLGMVSLLYFVDGVHGGDTVDGGGDIQFTFSHDGVKWFRQPDRQTFVEPSPAKLVPTYAQGNEPLDLGNEMLIYYTEASSAHPKTGDKSFIRAAVWRRDGFVSLDAAGKGSLTTQPLAFTGKQLLVNFKGESLRVTLLDEERKVIGASQPMEGDSVARPVTWKDESDLSALSGKPIRLRFELTKGQLWSFRFAQ